MAYSLNHRTIYGDTYDGTGYTNENSLANALLTKPDKITPVITHLFGREDQRFPLTFLTEGQKGGVRNDVAINDVQYTWDVFGRKRNGSKLVSSTYSSTDKPGVGSTIFYLTFEDDWLKDQYIVVSPGQVQAKIMGKPERVGVYFQYALQLVEPDPTYYLPYEEFQPGATWVMSGGAPVSESFSMGNESNVQMPGKLTNQISILRKSYRIGGNLANKVTEVRFNLGGTETMMWLPFEEYQHQNDWRLTCEEHLWWSIYNRRDTGEIVLKDKYSGLPIPIGAGVDQQIPHRDTYSVFTQQKLDQTVGDILTGATDTGKMTIVLYTGRGGAIEFDNASKNKMASFTQITGDKFITGSGWNLRIGGYFTAYEHIDGHVVLLKRLHLLDYGSRAENSPKHPRTGLPMSSYEMYFVDQSSYDGEPNLKMVTQKGRSMIRGVVKGMAPINAGEGITHSMDIFNKITASDYIATEKDETSVHYMATKNICIRRNTHCFKLTCSLS